MARAEAGQKQSYSQALTPPALAKALGVTENVIQIAFRAGCPHVRGRTSVQTYTTFVTRHIARVRACAGLNRLPAPKNMLVAADQVLITHEQMRSAEVLA